MRKITMGRGAVSDGMDTNATEQRTRELSNDKHTLIIYFSRSGNNEKQVRFAAQKLETDVYELGVKNPYPSDYFATVQRATEERESNDWPELIEDVPNLDQYDLILLAHPIWAMTPANPMRSFLEEHGSELEGKEIASFSTNDGYGSGDTQQVLRVLTPGNTTILNNYSVRDTQAESSRNEFSKWLSQLKR